MLKAREHAEAFKVALAGYTEDRDGEETLLKVAEIRWPNGSRLLAIPANPSTARGYSANLLLDEFAFHEDPDAIWRAIYPSISNPLKGQYRIRIVSTPNGQGNKFADIWLKGADASAAKGGWSKHKVDIYDAVAGGLPIDIEELKAGLDDPEGWAQEYECEFIDSSSVLLPYDLIAKCETSEASVAMPQEWWEQRDRSRPIYIGWDFARSRDLSVVWIDEQVGDVLFTREVIEMRGMATQDQIAAVLPKLEQATRICLDYTGNGTGCGDLLRPVFGEYDPDQHLFGRLELCKFSNALKVEVMQNLRIAFDRVGVRIPIRREIREDLHSMQRVALAGGGVTYRAPHNADGHADRCVAKGLAVRAAATGGTGAIASVAGIHVGGNGLNIPRFKPMYLRGARG
jgi:phage FluMu gp28-like protein